MVLNYIKQYIDILRRGRLIDDVHDDIRTAEEKSRDYVYGEDISLPSASISKRIKKLPIKPYDQGHTSACGAFSAAHARRLEHDEEYDPLPWYRSRSNYKSKGMFIKEVLELIAYAKRFVSTSTVSGRLTEEYANSYPAEEVIVSKNRLREYFYIKAYDANGVFAAVSDGNPTLITFYCTDDEWDEELIPKDVVYVSTARVRHYVVALPGSVHSRNGYEWVSVIDSSPNKGYHLRHARKDFLEQRMYLGGGFVKTTTGASLTTTNLPTNTCRYGDNNEKVSILQKYLVSQGLMDILNVTSYYGNITSRAVLKWQLANIKGANYSELTSLGGQYWGPLSVNAVIEKHK